MVSSQIRLARQYTSFPLSNPSSTKIQKQPSGSGALDCSQSIHESLAYKSRYSNDRTDVERRYPAGASVSYSKRYLLADLMSEKGKEM